MEKPAEPRTLLSGLAIGESPRWHEGRLWFSNWGTQEIIAVDLEGMNKVITPSRPLTPLYGTFVRTLQPLSRDG